MGIQNSGFKIPNSREAGYTLAIFVMVIAIMAIMMAAAVEIVSFQARREKEAELIFRGQQYVEGIRLYRQKNGPAGWRVLLENVQTGDRRGFATLQALYEYLDQATEPEPKNGEISSRVEVLDSPS